MRVRGTGHICPGAAGAATRGVQQRQGRDDDSERRVEPLGGVASSPSPRRTRMHQHGFKQRQRGPHSAHAATPANNADLPPGTRPPHATHAAVAFAVVVMWAIVSNVLWPLRPVYFCWPLWEISLCLRQSLL